MIDVQKKQFLASLSALLAKIAVADGVVAQSEIAIVESIWNRIGLSKEQLEYCATAFSAAIQDGVSIERYVHEFVGTKFGVESRSFIYELLWEVACADGVLRHAEANALRNLQNLLGLALDSYDYYYTLFINQDAKVIDETVERQRNDAKEKRKKRQEQRENERAHQQENARRRRLRPSGSTPLERAYNLLGANAEWTDKQLKDSYRKLAMRWHPDRLRLDGVPDELIHHANEKMAEINEAWNQIKAVRHI